MKRPTGALIMAALLVLSGGCASSTPGREAEATPPPGPVVANEPFPAEIAYARDMARIIYGPVESERSQRFATIDQAGYGLCLRSAGRDPVLLVFGQRLPGEAVSQVEDEVEIRRRPADTAVCRQDSIAWTGTR